MATAPMRSTEFGEQLLELQTTVDEAMRDGTITPAERRVIRGQFRLLQHEVNEMDAALRKAVSYIRIWRLSPTLIRYHGGDAPDEAA